MTTTRKLLAWLRSFWSFLEIDQDPLFRLVVVLFLVLIILNISTLLTGAASLEFLMASEFQWWGSFTSIILYDSWETIEVLIILLVFWFLVNRGVPKEERKKRSTFFCVAAILVSIISNYVWSIQQTDPKLFSSGMSGVGMAVDGMVLVFSVSNLLYLFASGDNIDYPTALNSNDRLVLRRFQIIVSILIIAATIIIPFTVVFSSTQSQNLFVHVASLTISIAISSVFAVSS